jgi:1-acyl-sn-glycerol-3-phosphate acyltransferase
MKLLGPLLILPRLLLVLLVTVAAHQVNLVSRLFLRPFRPAHHARIRHAAFRWWGRSFCRICGIRTEVEGTPPEGPFLLVSNHVSYIDIMVLGQFLDAVFIGKADLRRWPILGWMFHTSDTIFINRARRRDLLRVMEQVEDFRQKGYGVVLFPEGTSSKGDGILPLKPSLLEYAATRDLPVHWVTLSYVTPPGQPPAHHAVCWWGDELLLPHAYRFLQLPRVTATIHFGAEPLRSTDRKELAQTLRQTMLEAFRPMD